MANIDINAINAAANAVNSATPVGAPQSAVRQPQQTQRAPQDPGYTSILDRFWTDDFSAIPLIGPAASGAASGVTNFYNGWSNVLTWGVSALPGGLQTMDWDQAGKISPGQAVVANNVKMQQNGGLEGALALVAGGQGVAAAKQMDPNNPLFAQDFNVLGEKQRKAAFESGGFGQWASGGADTLIQFFLDPLVIAGKGLKIARFGSEMLGNIPGLSRAGEGLTSRSLASGAVVEKVGMEADTAMDLAVKGVSRKEDNVLGLYADEVVKSDYEQLLKMPIFQNENRDLLASIGADITDKQDAIVFLAAAAGNQKYIGLLRQRAMDSYDAMLRAGSRVDNYENAILTRPAGERAPVLADRVLEPSVDAEKLIADAARRDEGLAKALGYLDSGEQLLTRIGAVDNKFGQAVTRAGQNKRAVFQAADNIGRKSAKDAVGTVPGVVERVFNNTAGRRAIRVWEAADEFFTGSRSAGYVDVRGPNIGRSADDLYATLTDSKLLRKNKDFITEQMNLFGSALYSMDRRDAVKMVESNVKDFMSKQYGVDQKIANSIFASINKGRDEAIERVRAFGVDEDGVLVKAGPRLRSQLETRMPVLDMRVLDESFRIAARYVETGTLSLQGRAWETLEGGKNLLDEVASLWKASVLLRLGYTQRNLVEGWLRSAAVLGTIPIYKGQRGRKVNEYGYAAFAGKNEKVADLYRGLAGADDTVENTLMSKWERDASAYKTTDKWNKINPGGDRYFQELEGSVHQFRRDPVATMALRGKSVDDMVAWLSSRDATFYRKEMRLKYSDLDEFAAQTKGMVDRYLPDEATRLAAADADLSAQELASRLSDMQLNPIHGREVELKLRGANVRWMDPVNKVTGFAFKWLGSVPESQLVRHPFYAEVWDRRFQQLVDVAKHQGVDLNESVLNRINASAHRTAMRMVNDTLYTIERQSNLAHMLRFVMPFFPAWENSVRVWLGIVAKDPSVLARANTLWNIPNSLGLVVDKDGKQVGRENWTFLSPGEDRYVVLPAAMNEAFMKASGGIPFKASVGSFNVVTPGETPYLPGLGPLANLPVSAVLASRPDWQETIRTQLGDAVFKQIAPFGTVNGSFFDQFAPSAVKYAVTGFSGESDPEYLGTVSTMVQNAMVEWNLSGNDPAKKPNYDDIIKKAQDFYRFRVLASLTLPMSITRMSPYQVQVDAWNQLKADPSMTYEQKVEAFTRKWPNGEDYLPLVTSTSKYAANIDPTLASYKVLTGNEQLARELASLDPEAVGILAAAAPPGEFDAGVYKWLGETKVPGQDMYFRSRRGETEMDKAITMQQAWREFNHYKELRDVEMQKLGVKSLQAKAASDLNDEWKYFTDTYMPQKYGEAWSGTYGSWQDKSKIWLTAINAAMSNEQFMRQNGNSQLWQTVRVYMDGRAKAQQEIIDGVDSAVVRDSFESWAQELKYSSIEFSDFFDNFLANDNLTMRTVAA